MIIRPSKRLGYYLILAIPENTPRTVIQILRDPHLRRGKITMLLLLLFLLLLTLLLLVVLHCITVAFKMAILLRMICYLKQRMPRCLPLSFFEHPEASS